MKGRTIITKPGSDSRFPVFLSILPASSIQHSRARAPGNRTDSDMSAWGDAAHWQRLVSGEDCPICSKRGGWDPVAELDVSSVMTAADGPMRGYCWLPLRRHAVELHDLGPEEAAAYMRDLMRVSRAVQEVTGAVKMNYEIHGNTVPHLHTHIFPRYRGDRFEHGPIDPRAVKVPVYPAGGLERFRAELREALDRQV